MIESLPIDILRASGVSPTTGTGIIISDAIKCAKSSIRRACIPGEWKKSDVNGDCETMRVARLFATVDRNELREKIRERNN